MGVTLGRRVKGDSLNVWNDDCSVKQGIERMKGEIRGALGLGEEVDIQYFPHKGHIDFGQQHEKKKTSTTTGGGGVRSEASMVVEHWSVHITPPPSSSIIPPSPEKHKVQRPASPMKPRSSSQMGLSVLATRRRDVSPAPSKSKPSTSASSSSSSAAASSSSKRSKRRKAVGQSKEVKKNEESIPWVVAILGILVGLISLWFLLK